MDILAGRWVTDGGSETDLIFNKGIDLPEFASFPLIDDATGRQTLLDYYAEYATIAAAASTGLLLETPTWRANPDWGAVLGYDAAALDRLNRAAVELVREAIDQAEAPGLVSGCVGPRGDGYLADPDGGTTESYAAYHAAQITSFAEAGADLVHAMTMTTPAEAMGVVRSARAAGVPVAISFTVETDGTLPDGRPLHKAIELLEAEAPADWYGVNCAHPTHVAEALDGREWQTKVRMLRPNASTMTHEELDAMETLDTGDLGLLVSSAAELRRGLTNVSVVGGCCGTDRRHVAALWGV